MRTESLFFGYAVSLGVLIGLVYDGFRIWRRVILHSTFWVAVEDLLFWIFCGSRVFELMYRMSNGTLRWFAIFGGAGGILLYHKLVSPWLVRILSAWLLKSKRWIGKWMRWAFSPMIKGCLAVANAGKKVAERHRRRKKQIAAFAKKRLTSLGKVLKMIMTRK